MFELGARPHPPRELYRAYLEQSDVFVGLYWERYGWVAPEEEVSGLEDEYNLAPSTLPRLMYIKEPADAREPRLVELLGRIRNDDMASFKYFSTPTELGRLVEADLATLLAERFDESRAVLAAALASTEVGGGGEYRRRRSIRPRERPWLPAPAAHAADRARRRGRGARTDARATTPSAS